MPQPARPRHRPILPPWAVVLTAGLLAGLLLAWSHAVDTRSCSLVSDCLGNGISSLILLAAAPLLVVTAFLVTRLPGRDLLAAPVYALALIVVFPATRRAFAWADGFPLHGKNAGSVWAWLVASTVVLLAAWLAVRATEEGRDLRPAAGRHPLLRQGEQEPPRRHLPGQQPDDQRARIERPGPHRHGPQRPLLGGSLLSGIS